MGGGSKRITKRITKRIRALGGRVGPVLLCFARSMAPLAALVCQADFVARLRRWLMEDAFWWQPPPPSAGTEARSARSVSEAVYEVPPAAGRQVREGTGIPQARALVTALACVQYFSGVVQCPVRFAPPPVPALLLAETSFALFRCTATCWSCGRRHMLCARRLMPFQRS